ncbi:hypothetical protein MSAN_00642100 [Mycena sanguinolenta]|uniref:Uncharacterized protein n=1 Tax=Mycena sanguinolenta TaxID=230812 RepID=A0A8H7DC76_9AGAR|nr:hypothetical protein MSAN_00642100 [Mycena sanguinolenta]
MPRAGTATRQRAREGKSPVKPGRVGWVHGTKLAFFAAHKNEFLAAVETGKTGAFYTSMGHLYVGTYRYNTPWNGDLPEGKQIADDVDPNEDVDSLAPEVAAECAEYFKTLHSKIGVWYNTQYAGGQKKNKNVKTFKQLFDRTELEPPAPVKSRVLHFYSRHFYDERIKPRVLTRWAALSRLPESTRAYHRPQRVVAANEKEHETACEAYKIAMAKEVPTTAEEFSIAMKNAGHYLQPFAEAARTQYGMNVTILLCGPIPENGGRIEVRSVHAGFSNGLVPRIWSDFDRAGFDSAQRSFIAFTQNCFTEEECQARALSNNSSQSEGEGAEPTTTPMPLPVPLPENAGSAQPNTPPPPTMPPASLSLGPASSPFPQTLSLRGSASSGSSEDPPLMLLPPAMDPLSQSLMPLPGADAAWDVLMNDSPPGGWCGGDEGLYGDNWGLGLGLGLGEGYTGPVVREALGREISAMALGESLAYMARLGRMSTEEVEKENELAVRRAQEQEERVACLAPPTPGTAAAGITPPGNAPNLTAPPATAAAQPTAVSTTVIPAVAPSTGPAITTPTAAIPTPNTPATANPTTPTSVVPGPTPSTNAATMNPTAPTIVIPASKNPLTTPAANAGTTPPPQTTPEKGDAPHPKPKPAWRNARPADVLPDAEGGNDGGNKNADAEDGDDGQTRESEKDAAHRDEASKEALWQQPDEDAWPEELKAVYKALQRGMNFGGEVWKTCAQRLIEFERVCGFPAKGLVSAPAGTDEQRPEEVPAFIKRAQKWEKKSASWIETRASDKEWVVCGKVVDVVGTRAAGRAS